MHISPQDFRDVQQLIRSLCGLVLTDDKTYLVRTRLESVVQSHKCVSFTEYLNRLQLFNSTQMRDELVEALTTGETLFNRDRHPFEEFRKRILPELAETIRRRRESNYPIPLARIWSAGCSTGQEPYSIAMSIRDVFGGTMFPGIGPEHFPILATDVSARSLTVAKKGRYLERDLDRGITVEQRNRYFVQHNEYWTIRDELRHSIDFRRLNFIDPVENLGPFEVIFCRNVLIYFDEPTRQRLSSQFHRQLSVGGILILGAAESLYGLNTPFQTEQIGNTHVYRKTEDSPQGQ
jgi:chemotaxis protein methyltransferase CheR